MIRKPVGSIAVLFCATFSAWGASPTFEITVEAGRHERTNLPVRVQVPPREIPKANIAPVTLAGPGGKSIPAQWTKASLIPGDGGEVHFILPHLAAGESVRLNATLSTDSPPGTPGFTWKDHAGKHIDLRFGKRPVLTYHYERLDT